jgi:spoIIIJ-associated protein
MEKTLIASGKTIELAKEAALTQLGLTEDDLISYEVLSLPKAGFLGFGAQPAKVMVKYEVPDPVVEKPKSALGSASRSKPKAAPAPKAEAPKAEAPKAAPVKVEAPKVAPVKAEAPKAPKSEKKPAAPKAPKSEKKPAAPKAPKVYPVAEAGSVEERIETFLKGLLENMDSNAVPHAVKNGDSSYNVELTGDDLGYLIGRRGDTLDAIQRLCNYAVNHGTEGRIRISVDAEDYRAKREDSLRKYARKKAQQVLKARRRCSLEPMNAYERHVIHATLQEMENITTYSTGTEPNRRVVIEYVR